MICHGDFLNGSCFCDDRFNSNDDLLGKIDNCGVEFSVLSGMLVFAAVCLGGLLIRAFYTNFVIARSLVGGRRFDELFGFVFLIPLFSLFILQGEARILDELSTTYMHYRHLFRSSHTDLHTLCW